MSGSFLITKTALHDSGQHALVKLPTVGVTGRWRLISTVTTQEMFIDSLSGKMCFRSPLFVIQTWEELSDPDPRTNDLPSKLDGTPWEG